MFLGFSLLVWTFSKLSKTYEDEWRISVYYTNEESNNQDLGEMTVSVRASGFQFLKNKLFPIEIQVDNLWLAQIGGQPSERILANLTQKATQILPESVVLLQAKEVALKPIEKSLKSKSVPIVISNTDLVQKGYRFTHPPVFFPDSVRVYGNEEQLDKIKNIEIEKLEISKFFQHNNTEVKLSKKQLPPGVVLNTEQTQLTAEVQKLITVQKKIKVQVTHPPSDKKWVLLTDSVEVSWVTDLATQLKYNKSEWVAEVDFNQMKNHKLEVSLKNIPENFYNVKIHPEKIDYLLFEQNLP